MQKIKVKKKEKNLYLIPELGKQRQVDFSEFKANLAYRVSSRKALSQ